MTSVLTDQLQRYSSDCNCREYVVFCTSDKKVVSNKRLKKLEEELLKDLFFRVHHSCIVNRKKVTGHKGSGLLQSDVKMPMSDSYYESMKK